MIDHQAPRPRVIHVTGDFPDPLQPRKTDAIRRLVDLTADRFDHTVISLNRRTPAAGEVRAWLGREVAVHPAAFDYGLALRYGAPPAGIAHRAALERLGEWLARFLADGAPPALVVGHKLTIEGIAVEHAARRLRLPYALSIQGNTDERILRVRPDLRPTFARILRGAEAVFPFAPWALAAVERLTGVTVANPRLLPCATELDLPRAPQACGRGLMTAFHLQGWKTKNFDRTVSALRLLRTTNPAATLAVVGGGEGREAERCRAIGTQSHAVSFEGPLAHAAMPDRLNRSTGFVMPSRRESFGLVFIEALCAGLPIAYPAGQAIDGYFDRAAFAIRVDARSTGAIAAAMARLMDDEARMKAALLEWQQGPEVAQFQRQSIARQFTAGLQEAIAANALRV